MHIELRELVVYRNDLDAQIAKGLLHENEIEAYIRKDDCGGMEPQLQITEGIKVLVPSDQYEQAKSLLDKYKELNSEAMSGSQNLWKCSSCGELLEVQFSACWNCETPREINTD